jgi:prepilin signal peptidase PulO-like enzyme (type II secretory pathway)
MKSSLSSWITFGVIAALMIPVTIYDIKEKKIPDILILLGFILVIPVKLIISDRLSLWFLLDALLGFLFFAAVWFVTRGKIGLGDAKLSALLACGLGLPGWILAVFISSFTGSAVGLFLIKTKKMRQDEEMPFAPFLAAGFYMAFFTKDLLIRMFTYA